jgi:carbonic anhydrase/acetyltransferase-like protein (isoleucine patch superfamily)
MFIEYAGKVPRISETAFIAPTAVLIGDVEVGEGASIWFGVVLRADNGKIRIGAHAAIEDNAVVHAREDRITTIGDAATIGHCAVLDDCTIGKGALVGSNATILAGATIGTGSVVAAGSVVTVDAHVPAAVVVAGAPARVRKTLAGRSADWIAHSSEETGVQMLGYRRDGIGDPHHHDLVSTGRHRRGGSPVQTRHE